MSDRDRTADLHLHTNCSDGTLSPRELVALAKKNRVSAIAVVDHDTVDGLEEALSCGREAGVEVIPGIELTSELDGTEIHMLGYYIDHTQPALLRTLSFLQEARRARIYKMVEKLNALGLGVTSEAVFALATGGSVGRLHVARALAGGKFVSSVQEAFQRFIGDRGPAYVGGFKLPPKDAIGLILGAGGVPVLAHPYTMRRDELIGEFAALGLKGLEVFYPEHSQSMVNYYLQLAATLGLAVTGGSDFHGHAKPDIDLGVMKLPYEYVEKLAARRSA